MRYKTCIEPAVEVKLEKGRLVGLLKIRRPDCYGPYSIPVQRWVTYENAGSKPRKKKLSAFSSIRLQLPELDLDEEIARQPAAWADIWTFLHVDDAIVIHPDVRFEFLTAKQLKAFDVRCDGKRLVFHLYKPGLHAVERTISKVSLDLKTLEFTVKRITSMEEIRKKEKARNVVA